MDMWWKPSSSLFTKVSKHDTVPLTEPVMIGSSVLTFEEIQHGDVRTLVGVFQNAPLICNALQNNTVVR